MNDINNLFFELIRVAIGNAVCLSHTPTNAEWMQLYELAKKQSLVGICFAGVQRLQGQQQTLSEQLYLQWMGMAAKIQQRNEVMNVASRKIYKQLKDDGFEACQLKGQGFAALYKVKAERRELRDDSLELRDLSALRQSGDIDIWVMGDEVKTLSWAKEHGTVSRSDYHHAELEMDGMPEVELHYRPTLSRNLSRNKRLQRWFVDEDKKHVVYNEACGFAMPDYVFNVVLTLNHNLWHLMYEGVGMRQMMDLYFVLKTLSDSPSKGEKDELLRLLKHLKLQRFAAASMWVMKKVFGLEDKYLLCDPDERQGRFLLSEIMMAGNFGRYDERMQVKADGGRWSQLKRWMLHSCRMVIHYPQEVLWTPMGIAYISLNKVK